MTCVPSEDSDQPGHPPSLIKNLHCPHEDTFGPWLPKKAKTDQIGGMSRLIQVFPGCTGKFLVLSCGGSVCSFAGPQHFFFQNSCENFAYEQEFVYLSVCNFLRLASSVCKQVHLLELLK